MEANVNLASSMHNFPLHHQNCMHPKNAKHIQQLFQSARSNFVLPGDRTSPNKSSQVRTGVQLWRLLRFTVVTFIRLDCLTFRAIVRYTGSKVILIKSELSATRWWIESIQSMVLHEFSRTCFLCFSGYGLTVHTPERVYVLNCTNQSSRDKWAESIEQVELNKLVTIISDSLRW